MKNKNLIVVYLARTNKWVIPVPQINLKCILNPMKHVFSYLLYCKYAMFYILRKLPVPPLKN